MMPLSLTEPCQPLVSDTAESDSAMSMAKFNADISANFHPFVKIFHGINQRPLKEAVNENENLMELFLVLGVYSQICIHKYCEENYILVTVS